MILSHKKNDPQKKPFKSTRLDEVYVRKDTWEQRQKTIDERCCNEAQELKELKRSIKDAIDELKVESKGNRQIVISALVFVIATLVSVLTGIGLGLFR